MHLPRVLVAVLGCALLVIAGCGSAKPVAPSASAKPAFLPVAVSSEFGLGDRRVAWGLLDATGTKSAAAPDRTLSIGYRGPKGETIPATPLTFVWAQEGVKGIYVGRANFTSAGQWIADFTSASAGGTPATVSFSFPVAERTQVLGPGDPAPSVKTPTLAEVGGDVAKVSTDATPVKRFYETSEADALAAKKPFVLIFATPKFCQQAVCGPTLDKLKPIAAAHPELTFINVEPYQLKLENGSLQPLLDAQNNLVPVDATTAFKLQTEPYVFVVGADGTIKASFELVFSPDEIETAIKAIEAG